MKNYIFTSRSQHILSVMYQGRKFRVKFSTPYLGSHARYSTTDEELALCIKDTPAYRQGLIALEVKEVADVKKETAKAKEKVKEITNEKPLWAQTSMTKRGAAEQPKEQAAEVQNEAAEVQSEPEAAKTAETGEESLFVLNIEDVDNYMDAKAYLRDTLGVDADKIKNKEQVISYCQEHGIVFPNYELK